MPEPTVVRTMLGSRGVDLALRCLGSLRDCVHRPAFTLAIHDDGSLTEADRERLTARLGPCTFVERGSAEVAEKLARHPRCARFRDEHLFGLKLFDMPLLSAGRAVYLDTDILFTRPLVCPGYFEGTEGPFVAMQDLKESYAVRLRQWPVLRQRGIRLASRICAGMISFDPAAVLDLDYVEWLLGVDEETGLFDGFRFWAEQTIYAALAARAGARWIEPGECVIAHRASFAQTRRAAIIHFAGFSRGLLNDMPPAALDRPPLTLGTARAPECGLARRLVSALRTRLCFGESAASAPKQP